MGNTMSNRYLAGLGGPVGGVLNTTSATTSPNEIGTKQGVSQGTDNSPGINYTTYLIGFIILFVIMKIAIHKSKDTSFNLLGVGVYNFIAVGLMATFFMLSTKIIFAKYYVKGVSELVQVA